MCHRKCRSIWLYLLGLTAKLVVEVGSQVGLLELVEIHFQVQDFTVVGETPERLDPVVLLVVEKLWWLSRVVYWVTESVSLPGVVGCELVLSLGRLLELEEPRFLGEQIASLSEDVSLVQNLQFDGVVVHSRQDILAVVMTEHNFKGSQFLGCHLDFLVFERGKRVLNTFEGFLDCFLHFAFSLHDRIEALADFGSHVAVSLLPLGLRQF